MGDVTALLQQWQAGSRDAEARLYELLDPELRRIARSLTKRRRDATLSSAALVNELYIRFVNVKDRSWPNRRAFFNYAAKAMRRILIDHWRRRPRVLLVPLDDLTDRLRSKDEKIALAVAVADVLDDLARDHQDWCSVVEMKLYLGLGNSEVAKAMGVSLRTVERIWQDARWWLFERLQPKPSL